MARVVGRGRDTPHGPWPRAAGSGGLRGVVAAAILAGWRVAAGSWKKGKEVGKTSSPGPWTRAQALSPKLETPAREIFLDFGPRA